MTTAPTPPLEDRRRSRRRLTVVVVALAAGAALGLLLRLVVLDGAAPALALEPCDAQGLPARCGTLLVPEDRERPDGAEIGLDVVVLPARRQPAADEAFTVLAGGPGGAATDMTSWVASTFDGLRGTRDILLVDQRGTGESNPLTCLPPEASIDTDAEARAWVRSCLRSVDGDIRRYGTRAATDDLDDVREALGYRQLDVYGASYGATAAQAYLKRHPDAVRTLVLDGATEIDVPFYGRFAENAERALAQVASRCAADAACRAAFPRWRAQLAELIRAWDARPARTGENERTTGAGLAGVVQSMLLDASKAAQIPLLVSRLAAGDRAALDAFVAHGESAIQLMFWSIWCNEPWVGLEARGPWGTDFDGYAKVAIDEHRAACAYVPKRAEPASDWTLPQADVPVLALAGGADPQDPISNLPRLRQAFPDSRAIIVPHYGHTVAQHGCLGEVVSRFVLRGTAQGLDAGCVAAIVPPRFALP